MGERKLYTHMVWKIERFCSRVRLLHQFDMAAVAYYIPQYQTDQGGNPYPPPEHVAAIFRAQGLGAVWRVDIVPIGDTTASKEWALYPNTSRRFMAFVHAHLPPGLSPPALTSGSSDEPRRVQWEQTGAVSGDPRYWMVLPSESTTDPTPAVASYVFEEYTRTPAVILREPWGPQADILCALQGYGTRPGLGICTPGNDSALRYDLSGAMTVHYGISTPSATGNQGFCQAAFDEFYGADGRRRFASAPVAEDALDPRADYIINISGLYTSPNTVALHEMGRWLNDLPLQSGLLEITSYNGYVANNVLSIDMALRPRIVGGTNASRFLPAIEAVQQLCRSLDAATEPGLFTPRWTEHIQLRGLDSASA